MFMGNKNKFRIIIINWPYSSLFAKILYIFIRCIFAIK